MAAILSAEHIAKSYTLKKLITDATLYIGENDRIGVVGSINMDYRSLYHHFECGCVLIGSPAVTDIRDDFLNMFPQCEEVTEKYRTGRSAGLRLGQLILRLFGPLM